MTDIQEQLARLVSLKDKVTEEQLNTSGRYFDEHHCDLTQCHHGDTGNYRNRLDGEAVALLWNLWKAGAFDQPPRWPYELRVQIGRALDRLVSDESSPEQVDEFIQTFRDFGLTVSFTSPSPSSAVAECATCNGTGKEERHQLCRDCDEASATSSKGQANE